MKRVWILGERSWVEGGEDRRGCKVWFGMFMVKRCKGKCIFLYGKNGD